MLRRIKRLFVYFVVAALSFTGFTQSVQAALIGTAELAAVSASEPLREHLAVALTRPEVQAALERHGIARADAQARVAAMTDAEVQALASRLDTLPAGGDGIVGALLLIFLILLVTDILGLTKVFPFTRHR